MSSFPDIKQVQPALNDAQTVFVVLPAKVNFDQVAAGLSLFLSLKKAGKQVTLACSQPMTVAFAALVGLNQIQSRLGGRNLVIAFDYLEDSIEKVSYNIEDKKFKLTIQPKAGFAPLSADKVQYAYDGSRADLVIVLGATAFADLGELYQQNQDFFNRSKTLAISTQTFSQNFAQISFCDQNSAALCETTANLLAQLRLPVEADIATNLYAGLRKETQHFTVPQIGPATFEAAAFCLRQGARRLPSQPTKEGKTDSEPAPAAVPAEKTPEETKAPQPDWLEPKIYKSHTRI